MAHVPKYVIPLVIPPEMPRRHTPDGCSGSNICPETTYNIAVRQFRQQILPGGIWNALNGRTDGFPSTTVWGYGSQPDPLPRGLSIGGKRVQPAGVAPVPAAQSSFNYPSFTIEARAQEPTTVRWINELVAINPATGKPWGFLDARRVALNHLLPVDRTLHFANPERLPCFDRGSGNVVNNSTDCEPFIDPHVPNPLLAQTYDGPVPMVVHVHGQEGDPFSDGFPESWYLPAGRDAGGAPIALHYATRGSHYDQNPLLRRNLYPGSAAYAYTNDQPATTLWYHDHTLGMTANNVYAGPAGFFIVRGTYQRFDGVDVRDRPARGVLPGASDAFGRPTHPSMTYTTGSGVKRAGCDPNFDSACRAAIRDIGIVLQDRSFKSDGSLFYPSSRSYFEGGQAVPYAPEADSDVAPIHQPEFFGNALVVNGTVWPSLAVAPQRYRLRLLAGADSRTFNLSLWALSPEVTAPDADAPDYQGELRRLGRELPFYQIGAEQGFLPKVVKIKTGMAIPLPGDGSDPEVACVPSPLDPECERGLLMIPAERADVIVDFTGLAPGTRVRMINTGPDVPFGGFPIDENDRANPASTGQVMEFVVQAPDASTPVDGSTPAPLLVPASEPPVPGRNVGLQKVSLIEEDSSKICVQIAPDGSFGVAGTFSDPQPDIEQACRQFDAVPFGPTQTFVGTMEGGFPQPRHWADPVTVAPVRGENHIYEMYNYTVDAHPMHLHGARVQVVNREPLVPGPDGLPLVPAVASGEIFAPAASERGFKDVVLALPGFVTRVRARMDYEGLFVWHCHIVEHEDNEMMVPICARGSATDANCKSTPGGTPWPIENGGAGFGSTP